MQIALQQALCNRYTLEICEQTNQLLVYTSHLPVALHVYDTTPADEKETALEKVEDICLSFESMCTVLEDVYSRTRFIQHPAGYIADLNHHAHLAAKTNNSDWLYLYELPMVDKTIRWIQQIRQEKNNR